jgi:negative regulator of sigma-B (phosphoserine phosphatase)
LTLASAVRGRALRGEPESGDLHIVADYPGGTLVGAIDGLGHGEEAATAARLAAAVCREHAADSLSVLVQRCHAQLRRTRGVVLSLASFRDADGTMSWLGVGNVEGALFRAGADQNRPREDLICRPGIVGYRMPPLRESVLHICSGDMLVFVTDGIDGRFFGVEWPAQRDPADVADEILRIHAKESDDALVVVARYSGSPQ